MPGVIADPSNEAFWQPGWHAVGTALGPNQTPSYGDEPGMILCDFDCDSDQ